MPTIEGIKIKFRNKVYIPLTCNIRKKTLRYKDFTIISNNCWGGLIYESYNLPKQSPTVGLFFMAEDYMRFLKDIKGYLSEELCFISPEESKWKNEPIIYNDKRFGKYPIGKIKDIEIFFLHYRNEQEAKEKWYRRIERINWNKILVKFNDQNGCTKDHIKEFIELPYPNKIAFVCKKEWKIAESIIYIKQFIHREHVQSSREPFGKNRSCDVTALINQL